MRALAFLLLSSAALAQSGQPHVTNAQFENRPFSGDLAADIRSSSPAWFGYAIKTIAGDNESCCWNNDRACECRLEEGNDVTIRSGGKTPVPLESSLTDAVLFRVNGSSVEKIRVFSLACPLDAGGRSFIWLTGVPAGASLAWLDKLVVPKASDHVVDGAIFAIAQHDDPQADTILERYTRPDQPERVREKTTFWLGASRGARGVEILHSLLDHDSSEQVRDKAIFGLSISRQPEALEIMIRAARDDASAHVRGQAIFWLGQKAGKRAAATITNAIENDPDTDVKKRAVFALSQLPKDEGIPKLIEVARNQRNPEVRKQAFFWLGQSGDPRALAFIEQVLTH